MPLPCGMWWMSEASKLQHFTHTNRSLACISSKSFQSKCIKVAWAGLHGLLTAAETAFETWPALASLATNLTAPKCTSTSCSLHWTLIPLCADLGKKALHCCSKTSSLDLSELKIQKFANPQKLVQLSQLSFQFPSFLWRQPIFVPVQVQECNLRSLVETSTGQLIWEGNSLLFHCQSGDLILAHTISTCKVTSQKGWWVGGLVGHKPNGWRVVGLDLAKIKSHTNGPQLDKTNPKVLKFH